MSTYFGYDALKLLQFQLKYLIIAKHPILSHTRVLIKRTKRVLRWLCVPGNRLRKLRLEPFTQADGLASLVGFAQALPFIAVPVELK